MLRETGIRDDGTDSFIVRFEMKGFFSTTTTMCLRACTRPGAVHNMCVCVC